VEQVEQVGARPEVVSADFFVVPGWSSIVVSAVWAPMSRRFDGRAARPRAGRSFGLPALRV